MLVLLMIIPGMLRLPLLTDLNAYAAATVFEWYHAIVSPDGFLQAIKTPWWLQRLQVRRCEAKAFHACFHFRSSSKQVPEQATAVIFNHHNNGSLVYSQSGVGKPGLVQ
jgi:hypothetical protein